MPKETITFTIVILGLMFTIVYLLNDKLDAIQQTCEANYNLNQRFVSSFQIPFYDDISIKKNKKEKD